MNSTLTFNLYKLSDDASAFELELELDGMFRRWKLPLGPSMNPNKNRIAHETTSSPEAAIKGMRKPRSKKRTILERQLIDSGTYEPIAVPLGKHWHEELSKGYTEGKLALLFHGNYLKGGFSLAKFIHDNSYWLLVKKADMFASTSSELVFTTPDATPALTSAYSLTKTYAQERSVPALQYSLPRAPTTAVNYYQKVSSYILPYLPDFDQAMLLDNVYAGNFEFQMRHSNVPKFTLIQLEGPKLPMATFVRVLQNTHGPYQ
jgi:hypothetical protein